MEEQKHLFTAPQLMEILRRDAEKNNTLKIKNSPEFLATKNFSENSTFLEKLRQTKELSKEEFEKIFAFKAKENDEFFKLISLHLPQLSNDQLVYLIDFTNTEAKKYWAFRARCVAEAYSRCPKLKGGRDQKAPTGQGRVNLAKELASRFKTSVTNIQTDAKIIQIFGEYQEYQVETPTVSVGVSTSSEDAEYTRTKDNKYFDKIVKRIKQGVIAVATFEPHEGLDRGHYVIASRLYQKEAREAIQKAVEIIESGKSYTVAEMEAQYLPRKNQRVGYFQIEKLKYPNAAHRFEVTISEEDAKLLLRAFGKELDIKESEPYFVGYAWNQVIQQGYDSFIRILSKYIESKN